MTELLSSSPANMPVAEHFVALNEAARLRLQPFGAILERRIGGGRTDRWNLNQTALSVIRHCDGRHRLGDIVTAFVLDGDRPGPQRAAAVSEILGDLLKTGVLQLALQPEHRPPREVGSGGQLSPSHLMIELTDYCNLACRHCYRHSSPACTQFLETRRLLDILEEAAAAGIVAVELTGGEATAHPDFVEIAVFAAKRFEIVSILTNGTLMTQDMIEALASFTERFIIQVDLDGATKRQHEKLRGLRGSFEMAQTTIRRLVDAGFRVRAAMNVYPENVESVEDTFDLAMSLGAQWFGASPVMELGRAQRKHALDPEQFYRFSLTLDRLRRAHPQAIQGTEELERVAADPNANCGAGWRSLAIGPDGMVRPCAVFDPAAMSFGNINENDLATIFQRADLEYFLKLTPPGPETCTGCPMERFCRGCFARTLEAWRRAADQGVSFECNWAKASGFGARIAESNWQVADEIAVHQA